MTEQELAFLERLKQQYGSEPFAPAAAMEQFRISELPVLVSWELKARGPGIGATKVFTRWLAEAGAVRLDKRTNRGYLWRMS